MKSERHLVLGGARSGKTRHALQLATAMAGARGANVVYVATAEALDDEMRDRIRHHRMERPTHWVTVETPRELGRTLATIATDTVIVVDCLTLWLSNALLRDFDEAQPTAPLPCWSEERDSFLRYLADTPHAVVLVSNEVGGGIVPLAAVARRFQSEQGWLNQAVARVCDRVSLVVAGIPMTVK